MRTLDEIKSYIEENICVRQSDIIVAKKYIASYMTKCSCAETSILIEAFLKENGTPIPKTIALGDEIGRALAIDNAVKALSWKNAAIEAIWGLINNGILYPKVHGLHDTTFTLNCSSNGSSRGIPFPAIFLPVPQHVMRSYSFICIPKQPLTDPDLFLGEIDIPNLADDIKESLKEAVKCFRHDLYTPALAMLGRASEGAWVELGLALANALPKEPSSKADKIREAMEDTYSVAKKISIVREYCAQPEIKALLKKSGVGFGELDTAVIWSDSVRDSRKAVHYSANPKMKNTYEKIAALLIGAVPVIRNIYAIINSTTK
jgi:hypothetical protein